MENEEETLIDENVIEVSSAIPTISNFNVNYNTTSGLNNHTFGLYDTTSGSNSFIIGNDQMVSQSDIFKMVLGDSNTGYQKKFDIRSLFHIMKTLLKDNGYDDNLIYMEYQDLKMIMDRESCINNILKSDE